MADRSLIDDRRREADFYRNLLRGFRQGDLIFDIGAHQGSKTATFLRLGARVVATEPDEVMLHRCADKSIEVFWKASPASGR